MPFTISHAIVAYPVHHLARKKIRVMPVVIGSMSPDFPYLFLMTPVHAPGHSVPGVLIYCLLPALLILALWYRWLEKPILKLLALPRAQISFNIGEILLIILGVLIGAYSHVLWDATSHAYGYFVHNSDFWHTEVFDLPLYKLNQYGSGILGLSGLVFWYAKLKEKSLEVTELPHIKMACVIYTCSILFFVLAANLLHDAAGLSYIAVRSAIGLINGIAIGSVIYALCVRQNLHPA
ncbi:DUF4184 family protein [Rheinheimera tilapiae]|uniref:DUF4184 family protein n=1 Tax=Rheinheimera tilapiae TaxID=875043 RepID=A0ABV6B919_9GAMM